jgi:hypothetical protein
LAKRPEVDATRAALANNQTGIGLGMPAHFPYLLVLPDSLWEESS